MAKKRKQLEIQIKQRLRGGKEMGTKGKRSREDQSWRMIMKTISKLCECLTAVMMNIPQVRYMHTIGVVVLGMAVTRPGERCHGQRVP
jgi:hypothetical protein